jgi:mannose-1-phosphate guanylyltransferase
MAGGAGTRFWPASRRSRPKQLLTLITDESLLSATVRRVSPALVAAQNVLIVTGEHLADATRDNVDSLGARVLVEPMPRNTAPCIALAAVHVAAQDPTAVMAVLPADHFIADEDGFRRVYADAVRVAETGRIVTLGIQPNRPETGYGYIQRGDALDDGVFSVKAFVEKPDQETAIEYLTAGTYSWNSGMFFMRADVLLEAVKRHLPKLYAGMDAYGAALGTAQEHDKLVAAFTDAESISVDFGIMEKEAGNIAVIPSDFGWSDVGSWRSLLDFRGEEEHSYTRGDVTLTDCSDAVVMSTGPHVAVIGMDNVAVVATKDAVLVAPLDRSQDVGALVKKLRDKGRGELV